jgi:acetylornithine deacetylase
LDLHLPPNISPGDVVADLEEIFLACCDTSEGTKGELRPVTIDAGYEIPAKGRALNTLRSIFKSLNIPWEPDVFRSHSDANHVWTAGIKPIVLGPGRLDLAHSPDESVSFQKVLQAAEIYLAILNAATSDRW